MNWLDEAARSIIGSFHILRGRATEDVWNWFNLTDAGFWRSFSAFIIAAPIYLAASRLGVPAELDTDAQKAVVGAAMLKGLFVLALQWISWPIVMVFVARQLKLSQQYARYIIVYNWSTVLVLLIQVPPVLLYHYGLVSMQAAAFLMLFALGLVLYLRWQVARIALAAPALLAVMLVLLDMVISIGINRIFM